MGRVPAWSRAYQAIKLVEDLDGQMKSFIETLDTDCADADWMDDPAADTMNGRHPTVEIRLCLGGLKVALGGLRLMPCGWPEIRGVEALVYAVCYRMRAYANQLADR
jgi:hypothetical protein